MFYDAEDDCYWNTPLWYAIVAENHLSEQLIDPVIKYKKVEDDLTEGKCWLID